MEISETQWNQLVKRLDGLESSISDDRKDINKIQINLATIKEQNERILAMQVRGQEKMEKTVHDAVSESTQHLTDVAEVIASKPIKISENQAKNLGLIGKLHKTVRRWNQ